MADNNNIISNNEGPLSDETIISTNSPSFHETYLATGSFYQEFILQENRFYFNQTEQVLFCDLLKSYTTRFFFNNNNPNNAATYLGLSPTCEITNQMSFPNVIGLDHSSEQFRNRVEYSIVYESNNHDVSEYPSAFRNYVNENLTIVTEGLQYLGLPVVEAMQVFRVMITPFPSVSPSEFPSDFSEYDESSVVPSSLPTLHPPTSYPTSFPSVQPFYVPPNTTPINSNPLLIAVIAVVVVVVLMFTVCMYFCLCRKKEEKLIIAYATAIPDPEAQPDISDGLNNNTRDSSQDNYDIRVPVAQLVEEEDPQEAQESKEENMDEDHGDSWETKSEVGSQEENAIQNKVQKYNRKVRVAGLILPTTPANVEDNERNQKGSTGIGQDENTSENKVKKYKRKVGDVGLAINLVTTTTNEEIGEKQKEDYQKAISIDKSEGGESSESRVEKYKRKVEGAGLTMDNNS